MKTITLTKKMISIPSYLGNQTNEVKLAEFLCELFPFQKQVVAKNRFNLILPVKSPTLMIIGHLDTVPPSPDWPTNPFRPTINNNRLYGLGAADMKGSLAAFIAALISVKNKVNFKKLFLLFYVDEEYEFLGMKTFVNSEFIKINPKLILSLDGELKIQSGCRGCIELNLKFLGRSGHSAEPKSGINAIEVAVKVINQLKQKVTDPINLAYLSGGKKLNGNIIPAECFCTLEIRPLSPKIDAAKIIAILQQLSKKQKAALRVLKIRLDLAPWLPYAKKVNLVSGYVDVAMLTQKIKSPAIVFGAGGNNCHGPNENVPIKNLLIAEKFYQKTLLQYCRK